MLEVGLESALSSFCASGALEVSFSRQITNPCALERCEESYRAPALPSLFHSSFRSPQFQKVSVGRSGPQAPVEAGNLLYAFCPCRPIAEGFAFMKLAFFGVPTWTQATQTP